MGYIHPLLSLLTLAAAIYVLQLGWCRFCSLHLQQKRAFSWKQHVKYGTIVLALWALAPLGGLASARIIWGDVFVAQTHAWWGLAMLPLIITGYATGHWLDKVKKRRTWLPLLHGINNILLILMTLMQAWSGWELLAAL